MIGSRFVDVMAWVIAIVASLRCALTFLARWSGYSGASGALLRLQHSMAGVELLWFQWRWLLPAVVAWVWILTEAP